MIGAFRKISRVPSLSGGTKWYLSNDCLLAAKRIMYAVEYRRFYLHDLQSIVVWPNRSWRWRVIVPAAVFLMLGGALWQWVDSTTGEILCVVGLGWVARELALGPTASARICTTGASVDLPLVNRLRRASKVLAKVDAATRAMRNLPENPAVPAEMPRASQPSVQPAEVASLTPSIADGAQTNGS